MEMRRVTPLLLATSVFLSGATGLFVGAMSPAQAITSVDELSDVNHNHWAFEALQDLVEKYDVIEGYPDKTFRGNKMPTRWEMAAALNALMRSVGRDLARLGAEKANKSDLQTLARLQEEFKDELSALNSRTTALEARASSIEAKNEEQDVRLSLLEKTQIHGDVSFGGLADIGANGVHNEGNRSGDGFRDSLSAVGRMRLTLDIPVREDNEDSKIGRGDLHARIIGAFGRMAPQYTQAGNVGVYSPFSSYSRIAGDASRNNEGVNSGVASGLNGGGNLRQSLYIENVHYKQHFKAGIPLLTDWYIFPHDKKWETTGDMYVGVVPWRYLFDKSPYRGNEQTQFQNVSLVNTPGIPVNYNMPMVAYQWHQGMGDNMNLDLTSALATINNGDVYDGMNATGEARLNYKFGDTWLKNGSLYAGAYAAWLSGNTLGSVSTLSTSVNRANAASYSPGRQGTLNGYYAGLTQEIYKGIGVSGHWSWNDNSTTNGLFTSINQYNGAYATRTNQFSTFVVAPRQTWSGVLNIPLGAFTSGARAKDVIGLGYASLDFQENGLTGTKFRDKLEHVGEFYYKWQATDSIAIIPSAQVIANRMGLGANNLSYVIGLRTSYQF